MLFLVNDILDFAQFENKKIMLNLSNDVSIGLILAECTEVLMFKAETKQIELLYQVQPGFPEKIVTDSNRLRQILINLLSNSLKYTKRGSVVLEATCEQT